MAKYSNVVEYNIVTDVDSSGIVKLQNELTKLKQALKFDKSSFSQLGFDDAKIDKSIRKVNQLQAAITAAFNPKIGTIDLSKLNASLQREHTSLQMIVKDWEQMGTRGTMAISNLSNALLSMNKGAINVNTTLSKIANTFSNTVRWGITASIFQEMMSSVQGAVTYMKELDESLTNIQMVTNSSKEDMRQLAQYANQAAQALGSTTTDYTNAVKVFVQEGFSERESKQYANLSTKLANVSEQNTATTSDQITAYRNAFQLDYAQTVEAMDKVANVANNTASNVNELMTASQRAASVAQSVGASQDSFLAAIATIESVTRQSAEEIGNGLKTIYQRFADIQVSGKTEDGVEYGQYASALKSIGVDVLDATGNFKGFDQILTELQDVWSNLSETMKVAVGEKVAGKFQYNRFAALMNNREYYEKSYAATQGAGGMMDQMNEIYMEGIEGRLNTLQAAGEQVMTTLFNQDDIEPVLESATNILNVLNDMVDAAGGLSGVVQALGAIMLRTFSTQIAGTITNIATSISTVVANSRNANQLATSVNLLGLKNYGQAINQNSIAGQLVAGVADNYDKLSTQTQEKIRDLSSQIVELEEQKRNIYIDQEKVLEDIHIQSKEELRLAEEELQLREEEISAILQEAEANGTLTKEQKSQLEFLNQRAWELEDNVKLYNEITNSCAEYTKKLAEGKQLTTEEVNQLKAWRDQALQLNFHIAELDELLEQAGITTNSLNIAGKVKDTIIETANLEARINSIIKVLSSVTSVAFGFSMISDMFKTLADDSATLEDKLNAVIMNGLMGLTMLLPGILELAKGVKNLATAFIVSTAGINAETAAQLINNATLKEKIALIFAAIAAEVKHIAVIIAKTAALIKLRLALLAAVHPIAALAVVLTTGAVAVIALTKAYIDNYSALAKANQEYEKQKNILTETSRAYQDTADQVEQLKTSLDKIGDSRKALKDLTEGTDEWKQAVIQLNEQILQLLQLYPQLAQYVNNVNGVLTLDEKGTQAFLDQQMQKASNLKDINTIQQVNTLKAQNNQSIEKFAADKNISADIVRDTLASGKVEVEGRSDLTDAFAALKSSVDANNHAIQTLTGTLGILNTTYKDYASTDIDNEGAKQAVQSKWGTQDEYGNVTYAYGALANSPAFIETIGSALQEQITSMSFADNKFTVKTATNQEGVEYSADMMMQLAVSAEILDQRFQENAEIYRAFGAEFDPISKTFKNAAGETVKSLDELGANTDELAAIDAYRKGNYNDIADKEKQFDGSLLDFVDALANGKISVDGFADKLNNFTPNSDSDSSTPFLDTAKKNQGLENGDDYKAYRNYEFANSSELQGVQQSAIETTEEQIAALEKENETLQKTSGLYNKLSEKKSKGIKLTKEESTKWAELTKEHLKNAQQVRKNNKTIEDLNDSLTKDSARVDELIERNLVLKDGYEQLQKSVKDYQEAEGDQVKESAAVSGMQHALSEMTGQDVSNFDTDFVIENIDKIIAAAEQGGEALTNLQRIAAEHIIVKANVEGLEEIPDAVAQMLNEAQNIANDSSIQAYAGLDATWFVQGLMEMAQNAQLTAQQVETIMNALSSMGISFNVDTNQLVSAVNSAVGILKNISAVAELVPGGEGEALRVKVNTYMAQAAGTIAGNLVSLNKVGSIPSGGTVGPTGTGCFIAGTLITLKEGFKKIEDVKVGDVVLSYNRQFKMNQYSRVVDTMIHDVDELIYTLYIEDEKLVVTGIHRFFINNNEWIAAANLKVHDKVLFADGTLHEITQIDVKVQKVRVYNFEVSYNHNYYVGKHQILAHNKGKSSGSSKDNKNKEKIKSEWDYLTNITNDLERLDYTIEKLNKSSDRLYGKDRKKNLEDLTDAHNKHIKKLKEENNEVQKQLDLMNNNATNSKKKAKTLIYTKDTKVNGKVHKKGSFTSAAYDRNGNLTAAAYAQQAKNSKGKSIGLKLDKEGNIENGKTIEAYYVNQVNKAIATYNKHKNDDDTTKWENAIAVAEKNLEGWRQAFQDYQETISLQESIKNNIIDEKQVIQDNADAVIDMIQDQIDKVINAINSQRDFNKMQRQWYSGGSGYSNFDAERRYYVEGLQGLFNNTNLKDSIFMQQADSLKERITEAREAFNLDNNNLLKKNKKDPNDTEVSQEAAQDNLTKAVENAIKSLQDAIEYYDSIWEVISEVSSKMDELIDNRLEKFNRIIDHLDTRLEQVQLLIGDNYKVQTEFYNQRIATNLEKMNTIATSIEAKQATVKKLESLEATNKQLSSEERTELREARDKINELQEEQLSTETELLQDVINKLTSETNAAMQQMVNSMFGGDIDWLSQQWEIATRNSEQYLDDYNKAFEVQKLQLKYQDLLNNTQQTALATQQKISAQMNQQLKLLREKDNLSNYDVQYAQMQLNILQKRIALEEAQNKKSQLRLQRNAAGNYDFVYAANQDAMAKANEELINAQQEAYNLSKETAKQTYESAFQAAQETKDMIVEVATNASLSVEERTRRIQYILDNLKEYMSNSSVEFSNISVNLYNDFVSAEQLVAEANLGNLSDVYDRIRQESGLTTGTLTLDIERYGTRTSEILVNIDSDAKTTFNNIDNNAKIAWDNIDSNTTVSWSSISDKVTSAIGTINNNFSIMHENMIKSPEQLQGIIETAMLSINTSLDTYETKVGEVLKSAGDDYDTVKEKINNAKDSTTGLNSATGTLKETLTGVEDLYKGLIENGLDKAKTSTDGLVTSTETFNKDLGLLKTTLDECATNIDAWEGSISSAFTSLQELVPEATKLQGVLNDIKINLGIIGATGITGNTGTGNTGTTTTTTKTKHTNTQVAQGIANAILKGKSGWGSTSKKQTTNITHVYNKEVADEVAKLVKAKTTTKGVEAITYSSKTKKSSTGHDYKDNSLLSERIASAILQGNKNNDYNGWGSGKTRKERITNRYNWDVAFTVEELIKAANTKERKKQLMESTPLKYTKNGSFTFASGGYTGTWNVPGVDNEGGKWAVLHQKELVLNADDTKNMLSAVQVVRDIVSNIGSLSSIGNTFSPNSYSGDTIQQRVEINATFPGVTTALEIEKALTQLADNAYQYANKYKY